MTEISGDNHSSGTAISTVRTGLPLDSFNFDLDSGILTLQYGKEINPLSLDFSLFTLQSALQSSITYSLTSGVAIQTTAVSNLDIRLSDQDLNIIKTMEYLATSQNNTFLSFDFGSLEDIFGNPVRPLTSETAIMVSVFIPDITPPYLTTFEVLSASNERDILLLIVFSEPVIIASLNPTSFTLLEAPNSHNQYTLTGGRNLSYGRTFIDVLIMLSQSDREAIVERYPLGSVVSSTYLSAHAGAVEDVSGSPLLPIDIANAVQASHISVDLIPPSLNSFSLDLNIGVLSLNFSEVVAPSTLNISLIYLQSSSSSSIMSQTIENSGIISTSNSTIVIQISLSELNAIKVETELGTQIADTYISFKRGLIQDLNQNLAFGIASSDALRASMYLPDITPPYIVGFDLDMNVGLLLITFTEPVDHSSFDQHQIEIQSSTSQPTSVVRLGKVTGPQFTDSSKDSPILIVPLLRSDLFELQRTEVASSLQTTFLALHSSVIADMNGNNVVAVSNSNALGVTTFIEDASSPMIESFILDYTLEHLQLIFSEVVDLSTFLVNDFILQNKHYLDSDTLTFSLTSNSTLLAMDFDGNVVDIEIGAEDFNAIKSFDNFATNLTNTFLSMPFIGVLDTSGNRMVLISSFNALQATMIVVSDTVPPVIEQFSLDLNQGEVSIVFGEVVNIMSIQVSQFTLQNAPINATVIVSLTTGAVTPINSTTSTLYITLTGRGLDLVKARNIANSIDDTYLSVIEGAIFDTANNAIVSHTLRATSVVADVTSPSLMSVTFNLDHGVLTLNFNEAIDPNSLLLIALVIADEIVSENDTMEVVEFRLSGGTITFSSDNLREIIISLTREDSDEIEHTGVCAHPHGCFAYFSRSSQAVTDFAGNVVTETFSDAVRVDLVPRVSTPSVNGKVESGSQEL